MRCSSIPSSLILVAAAALTFGACSAEQTEPGGAGATPPASTASAAGSGTSAAAAAGMTGGASTAGKTGSATSPATGAAGSGTATGKPTGAAGASTGAATGAAGASTGAASGSAGATASGGAAGATTSGGAAGASTGAAGGGAAGGAAAGGAVTFTRVHEEVLTGAGCATPGCHGNAQGPSKLGFADKADAYMGLVGIKAMGMQSPGGTKGGCMGMPIDRVKAGDPAMSLLVQKLENKQTCGDSMPPGSSIKPELIQLVKDWIMAGAKDD